jgi:Putative Ig domain/Beta-galactosidase
MWRVYQRKIALICFVFIGCYQIILAQTIPADKQRYLATMILNIGNGEPWELEGLDNMLKAGSNAALITVGWGNVYKYKGAIADWSAIDKELAIVQKYNAKVAFRIHLQRKRIDQGGAWWPEDVTMKDHNGDDIRDNVISYSYEPCVTAALAFVKEVAQRYRYLQEQDKLLFLSATFSPTQEGGYHYDNKKSTDQDSYLAMYDYSDVAIKGYHQWLQNKYKDLKSLNKYWQSDYATFEQIKPITLEQLNNERPNVSQRTFDWYRYRHFNLKNIQDKVISTIKAVHSSYKVVNEYGSVYDGISHLRCTLAFTDLIENADGLKINDDIHYPYRFSTDLVRSNIGNKMMMNEVFIKTEDTMPEIMNMFNTLYENGCNLVASVVRGAGLQKNEAELMAPIVAQIKRDWLSKPMTPIVPKETFEIRLSDVMESWGLYNDAIADWNGLYASSLKPVNIKFVDDVVRGETGNLRPILQGAIANQTATVGSSYSLTIPNDLFKDPDGTITKYVLEGLPAGLSYANGLVSGIATTIADHKVVVKAYDNAGEYTILCFYMYVRAKSANIAPTVQYVIPNQQSNISQSFYYSIPKTTFADSDGTVVSISATGLPSGLYMSGWNVIGVPTQAGTFTVSVQALDNNSATSPKTTFTITVLSNKTAPTVTKIPANQSAVLNQNYTYPIPINTFSDADGFIAQITVSGLPEGLSFNAITNTISGKPLKAIASTITITATDNDGLTASTSYVLTVQKSQANQPPIIVTPFPDYNIIVNQPFTTIIPINNYTDSDGFIVNMSVSGLPTGLSYNSGVISGTPTQTGKYTVTIKLNDNQGASVQDVFIINVNYDLTKSLQLEANLTNASTKQIIAVLKNGASFVGTNLPSVVNIIIKPTQAIDYVISTIDGPISFGFKDTQAPYSITYSEAGFAPYYGNYTLTMEAYRNNVLVATNIIKFSIDVYASLNGRISGEGGSQTPIVEKAEEWAIAPNPFDDVIKVTVPSNYTPNQTMFSVINTRGQAFGLNNVWWEQNVAEIRIGNLPMGDYLLQIQNADLPSKTLKLIKK